MTKNIKKKIAVALGIFLIAVTTAGCSERASVTVSRTTSALPSVKVPHMYRVTAILTGDTLEIDVNDEIEKVRLIGLQTPSMEAPTECFAEEAKAALENRIKNQKIRLETDPEQQDRGDNGELLRYAFLDDDTDIGLALIHDGYARTQADDTAYAQYRTYEEAYEKAKNERLGLWSPEACYGQAIDPESDFLPAEPNPPTDKDREKPPQPIRPAPLPLPAPLPA